LNRFLSAQLFVLQCNKLLVTHIRRVLPKLKANIKDQIKTLVADLDRIGELAAPTDVTQRGYLLLRLIGDFANAFRAAIEGQRERDLTTASDKNYKLNGGARIRHIFNEVFDKNLERIDPLDGLDDRDIQAAIRNAAGPKPAIFIPEAAFEMLAKRQIRKLLDPALECIDRVHSELLKIMLEIDEASVAQFPALADKFRRLCGFCIFL
jgi:dynamin 1-like protein